MQSNHPEEWRPVSGYEDAYEVSNHGRVRSLDRELPNSATTTRFLSGRVLKHYVIRYGYHRVTLWKSNKSNRIVVHKLVLEAFVGPKPEGMECRHLDGNPANNHLTNLVWGTSAENKKDIVRHGKHHGQKKTHCPRGHELVFPNLVASAWEKRNYRECLACSRAQSRISYHKHEKPRFVELANENYKKIMT